MAQSTSYSTINSLGDFSMIAGSTYTLKFNVENQTGGSVNITSASCIWRLSPYGSGSTILTKTGSVISTALFSIVLSENDTKYLSGKYSHQPIITFASGAIVKPAQGIITIVQGLN